MSIYIAQDGSLTVRLRGRDLLAALRGEMQWIVASLDASSWDLRINEYRQACLTVPSTRITLPVRLAAGAVGSDVDQILSALDSQGARDATPSLKESIQRKIAQGPGRKIAVLRIEPDAAHFHNKFIISGGPGFGKTTTLALLNQLGYTVFHEVANALIDEQQSLADPALPWTDRVAFDNLAIDRIKSQYDSYTGKAPAFFDRGFPDLIGWRRFDGLGYKDIADWVYTNPYERTVFVTRPRREIYVQAQARPFTFDQAANINETLARAYSWLGYDVVYLPNADPLERAEFVLDKIGCRSCE